MPAPPLPCWRPGAREAGREDYPWRRLALLGAGRDRIHVRKVLRAAGRQLVPDERGPPENPDVVRAQPSDDTVRPGLLPRDAADGRDDVDLHRLHAHLEHATRLEQVRGPKLGGRKAEGRDGVEETRRIVKRGPHEDVEIAGETWSAVQRER